MAARPITEPTTTRDLGVLRCRVSSHGGPQDSGKGKALKIVNGGGFKVRARGGPSSSSSAPLLCRLSASCERRADQLDRAREGERDCTIDMA